MEMLLLGFCLLILQAQGRRFSKQWAVEISGGEDFASGLATDHGFLNLGKVFPEQNIFIFQEHSRKTRSSDTDTTSSHFTNNEKVLWAEQLVPRKRVKRSLYYDFSDPLWNDTWYLLPSKHPSMKVLEAWNEGFTGKGVLVAVVDDGIEHTHPDLVDNYEEAASYDINDNDLDPMPRMTYTNENNHGTRLSGVIAGKANNDKCTAGIAWNARLGGIRMLDGNVNDAVEAKSITIRNNVTDIFCISWGPDDDGRTVDGPGVLMTSAIVKGIKEGRAGKGSIFVMSSGNGGRDDDDCNLDGYVTSIYTISIGSVTERNLKPWYSEKCSSIMASTYSSGSSTDRRVVTTDLRGKCTTKLSGNSAAAGMASGICALALEANPDLTWRDMQHLIVRTANPTDLSDGNWTENGAGRKVSHIYGFGMMDAHAMVKQAKSWESVPKQIKCTVRMIKGVNEDWYFSWNSPLSIRFQASNCQYGSHLPERLEHVVIVVSTTSFQARGKLSITLTSPMGTRSTLLHYRKLDNKYGRFSLWPFMSVHFWDENPEGEWILELTGKGREGGILLPFTISFYGTMNEAWQKPTSLIPLQVSPTEKTGTDVAYVDKLQQRAGYLVCKVECAVKNACACLESFQAI